MSIKKLLAGALLLLFSLTSFGLKVGDKAVDLKVKNWIKNGPVQIEKGKIYVVEFWATWCPPCRTSIPHLSKLQKKFKKDGVVVVGISSEKKSKVEKFVKKQTDMNYSVATDANGQVYKKYMKEYRGIPNAFVVDKKGMIVWVGHPLDLDGIIEKVIKGEAIPKEVKKERKIDLNKILENAEKKIKANKDDARAHLIKIWVSFDLNKADKWLKAFNYLDKNEKLKKSKNLTAFYKGKEVIKSLQDKKIDAAVKQLNETSKMKRVSDRNLVMISVIYYNYINTQKGEKNLFNDKFKEFLLKKIDKECKKEKISLDDKSYLLNIKAFLQASCKDYKEAIETEKKALEIINKMEDNSIKPVVMNLIKKNLETFKKQLKKSK